MSINATAITQHPYYLVNHYQLLKNKNSEAADKQRAALYFNDAGFLQILLSEENSEAVIKASAEKPFTFEIPTREQINALTNREPVIIAAPDDDVAAEQGDEAIADTFIPAASPDEHAEAKPIDAGFSESFIATAEPDETSVETITVEPVVIAETETDVIDPSQDTPIVKPEAIENNTDKTGIAVVEPEQKPVTQANDDAVTGKLSSILSDQLAAFKKPVSSNEKILIDSEPFHTVDYFASQGIKLDLANGNDQFTKRVRKFTDWLKDMKTTPQTKIQLQSDAESEIKVQQTANQSNETREIITESMAEVLVMQGKLKAAIELYEKLSFINPEKNSYFAAKISQLNEL